jgi:hypothetical protein
MVPHVGSVILSKVRPVSDAEKLNLRGPVRALREESSSWDFSQGAWGPPHVTITTFRRDGYVSTRERRTRIGFSRAVHTYDAAGRLTEIEWWHDGGLRTKTLKSYDHSGRPIETVQVSEDGSDIRARHCPTTMPAIKRGSGMENLAPDRRAELEQLLTNAFVNWTFSGTTFDYDQNGRLLRKTARMGVLDEERTTYRYDGRDNPIEAITEGRSREIRIEDGTVLPREQPMREQRTRFDYRYDPWGNWTQRVTLMRIDAEKAFQRTAMDRRINTYY